MRSTRRAILGLLAGAWAAALFGCATAPAERPAPWVAAWGSAQLALEPAAPAASQPAPAPAWREPLRDVSLRQVLRVTAAGSALRVRISNALGRTPLRVSAAAVARVQAPGAAAGDAAVLPALRPGTLLPLTFGASRSLLLAPGEEAWSDPLPLAVQRGEELAVQLHVAEGSTPASAHPGSRIHSWAVPGNAVDSTEWPGAAPRIGWWHLAAVDVRAARPQAVLVAIGDSITDGYGVPPASYQRWTDHLARRLAEAGREAAVVNTGIGGNRLLRDGLGPNLLSRFERDALARSGVTHAVLLIGVNDFGAQRRAGQDTPEARAALLAAMQDGLHNLALRAHERGVCLIAATVLPYGSSGYYQPAGPNEADRLALNRWIREAAFFDGLVDFDALGRDPQRPAQMRAGFDSGDGLHPSLAGYREMAEAFPLPLLDQRCGTPPRNPAHGDTTR